ncbi:MAG: hypothetical protein P9L99_17440 [Candidatus Lernaella stagnicola]|nr:hypothetical protein [Candidatus Lernaella stagnicola]
MKRLVPVFLVMLLVFSACTVTKTKLRLDMLDMEGLPEADVAADITALRSRAEGLWSSLEARKLSTHLTKDRIRDYFESDQDLSDFIAIYASLFRQEHFAREYVRDFEIGEIIIEPNGVLARVEVNIWGKIYFIWNHRIHEVQTWKKIGGVWMLKPLTY